MISEGRAPNWFEPLFTLAFCAARTKTMKVGTAVLIARYRDLFVLRKQAATLDQLDGGRFLVCFGLGMCQDELTALRPRLVQSHRGNVLEELIESLQLPLASGRLPVSYEGEGAASPEVRFYREPIQKPLPIYAPARTRATFGRICRLGLGLMTSSGGGPRGAGGPETAARGARTRRRHRGRGQNTDKTDTGKGRSGLLSKPPGAGARAKRGRPRETVIEDNWIGTADGVADRI